MSPEAVVLPLPSPLDAFHEACDALDRATETLTQKARLYDSLMGLNFGVFKSLRPACVEAQAQLEAALALYVEASDAVNELQ